MSASTATTEHYPVGLTVREIEQRAWVEGGLRTAALLAAKSQDRFANGADGTDYAKFTLAVRGQLPLKLEKN